MTFAQTASEVITKSEEKMRGSTLQCTLLIKTIRPSWTREMKINIWMKGDDYAMIRVQSPEKDKGITFLKRGKELWNWIPAIDKTTKLPPSMTSQFWMGSDFAYYCRSPKYMTKISSKSFSSLC